jgi:hypothetical protein
MAIIRTNWDTSTNKDAFKTLVRKWFDSTDREAIVEYPRVFKTYTTKDEYERHGRYAGLDYPGELDEGENIPIQDPKFNGVKDYEQVAYGSGFRITDRMKRFNKIGAMETFTKSLRRMQREGKDVEVAKIWNNLTATTYTNTFDTLAVATNSHTCLDDAATTYDNYADEALAVGSLESALQYFDYMYDDQGNVFIAQPDTLVVNYTLRQDAFELLKSEMKPWEQSNTKSAYQGALEPFVYHRLTASTTWFVLAKNHPKYGAFVYTSMEPDLVVKDAPDTTRDTLVTSLQYFDFSVDDARLIYVGDA